MINNNKYGVKVGDIFMTTWGYDETNVNFFQVKQLVGERSIRVVEVIPEIIRETTVSSMSGDFTFQLSRTPLPTKTNSLFIQDQIKGDLKRLRVRFDDDPPSFTVCGYAEARLCNSGSVTVNLSWYA